MKRKFSVMLALLLGAAMLLAACGGAPMTDTSAAPTNSIEEYDYEETEASLLDDVSLVGGMGDAMISDVYTQENVKLIRRADLSFETQSFDETAQQLKELTQNLNGYYEQSELYTGGYYGSSAKNATYIIRIPSASYDDFMGQMGELAHMVSCVESTENIGEQYYDTELRLQTQETKRQRLLALMEESADLEQMLQAEQALSETEYEIERLSSTLKRYDSLVDYASFTINLREVGELTELSGVETLSFAQRLGDGFRSGMSNAVRGLQSLLIWIAYHFLSLIIFAAVLFVVVFVLRIQRRKRLNSKLDAEENQNGK